MNSAVDWNRLGIESKQRGDWDGAVACYQQALAIQPDFAEAHYNLGLLWRDLGRIDQAFGCLRQVCSLRPDVLAARLELARLYVAIQDFDAAEEECRLVIEQSPHSVDGLFQLSAVYAEQGRWKSAEATLQRVIELAPQSADAWTCLGNALRELQQSHAAAAAYRTALQFDPHQAAALTNLGGLLRAEGNAREALDCHQQAVLANPELPEAYVNLANTLHQLDRDQEALQAYQQATRLAPDNTDAWVGLGHLLRDLGDMEQARRVYHAVAQRDAGEPLHVLRQIAACPTVFLSHDELAAYRDEFLETTVRLRDSLQSRAWTQLVDGPECPFNLQFLDGNLRALKESFAAVYAPSFAKNQPDLRARPRGSKPRIGFVAITRWASSFLEPFGGLVHRLDRNQFDVAVVCRHENVPHVRAGLNAREIEVLGVSDRIVDASETVRKARFDLLHYLEVGNTPANYFLPFLRLAPVQVTSWGIQVTAGIPTLDAYLSSRWIEGPDAAQHYSERLILGNTMLTCRLPVELPAQRKGREAFGFPPQQRLYGCLQNLGKFHPDFDRLLGELLRADPTGRLVLLEDRSGIAAQRLRARLRTTLADVWDRVVFLPNLRHPDYLCMLLACDVLLDPPHFGGVSTTYDAIALGKPIVTWPSGFQRGSYTAGLLRKLGVTETIVSSAPEYVQRAVRLGQDPAFRELVSARLLDARGQAFQAAEAVREHEQLFLELLDSQ